MTVKNQYLRPNGYVECRKCRKTALEHCRKRHPLTFDLIKSKKDAFWRLVKRHPGANACWPWRGRINKQTKYGLFCLGPRSIHAHRMALVLKLGRLVRGMSCHKCGNHACCRGAHVYEGTAASNASDRDRHGTTARGERSGAHQKPESRARGERSGMAKLTDKAVVQIRSLYATEKWRQIDLATRFNVSQRTISLVTRREIWRHL